jgi:hypothetical protein
MPTLWLHHTPLQCLRPIVWNWNPEPECHVCGIKPSKSGPRIVPFWPVCPYIEPTLQHPGMLRAHLELFVWNLLQNLRQWHAGADGGTRVRRFSVAIERVKYSMRWPEASSTYSVQFRGLRFRLEHRPMDDVHPRVRIRQTDQACDLHVPGRKCPRTLHLA